MPYNFDRVRILIIEDNLPMLEICKTLIKTFGIGEVLVAKNGEDGFEVFCRENPDMVVADWMMEPMDGITLTKKIRTDPKSVNPYVPIILMTGFSEKKRVIQARDCGVTEFLVKPFAARDLYKRIAQIIERPRQFVKADGFFGPDRRRKSTQEFSGPFRRDSDPSDLKKLQTERMKEASFHLDTLREKAGMTKSDKFDEKVFEIDFQ